MIIIHVGFHSLTLVAPYAILLVAVGDKKLFFAKDQL